MSILERSAIVKIYQYIIKNYPRTIYIFSLFVGVCQDPKLDLNKLIPSWPIYGQSVDFIPGIDYLLNFGRDFSPPRIWRSISPLAFLGFPVERSSIDIIMSLSKGVDDP